MPEISRFLGIVSRYLLQRAWGPAFSRRQAVPGSSWVSHACVAERRRFGARDPAR